MRKKILKKNPFKDFATYYEIIVSFIAFLVWALAIQGGPYMQKEKAPAAAILALIVSAFLFLLDPIFKKKSN